MLDGRIIAEELRGMAGRDPDAILKHAVERLRQGGDNYDWVGIYLLAGDQLILHNYVGRATEHARIPVGRGICGTAVAEGRDINVPDVQAVENYLACSFETRSEIVVLIRSGDRILGQIDIDSDTPAAFDDSDEREIRVVADALGETLADRLSHDQ